ncbi:MAG: PAS domain-containing protein [Actinomycetota bacterium]|nr:PAS domain-containing protein [Actinomycetota bacterium]
MLVSPQNRAALTLVHSAPDAPSEPAWFCGNCGAPAPRRTPPAPNARVCQACGLGVLLEARADVRPSPRDAFLVVDATLAVQALSRRAERLLDVSEEQAINRPVGELLVAADTEDRARREFSEAIVAAASGAQEPTHVYVRPWNTFGVRMRARVGSCGPPRAALLVLASGHVPPLRSVD